MFNEGGIWMNLSKPNIKRKIIIIFCIMMIFPIMISIVSLCMMKQLQRMSIMEFQSAVLYLEESSEYPSRHTLEDLSEKFMRKITAISSRGFIIIIFFTTGFVLVTLLSCFILVQNIDAHTSILQYQNEYTPEEIAKTLERLAGRIRARKRDKPKTLH